MTVVYKAAIVGRDVVVALEVDHGHDGEVEVDAEHVVEGEPEEAKKGHNITDWNESCLLVIF